jgi:hypothetical protein
MLGCLKAFLKSTVERRFYDLGRIGYKGGSQVDFKFDASKVLTPEQLAMLQAKRAPNEPKLSSASVMACGGGPEASMHREVVPEVPVTEEPIDAFMDPRGFARQRAQAKGGAAPAEELLTGEVKTTPPPPVE